MPAPRLVAIVGRPGSGKTTLADALAAEYARRGLRVGRLDCSADPDPLATARRAALDGRHDLLLAEGARAPGIPRIEVWLRRSPPAPLYDPASPDAEDWIAVLTDDYEFDAPCRVFRFQDTMWLQFLASVAWDRARVVR